MIAFFDEAHMEGQWKHIERASRYPFHPVSIFAGFFYFTINEQIQKSAQKYSYYAEKAL